MNCHKFIVILLLSCSVVPLLFASQAFSQTSTTITTILTSQVPYTNTQTTPLSSMTQTTTQETVQSEMWTQSGVGERSCYIETYDFEAEGGQPVTGTIAANQQNSLVVYLLSDEQHSAWAKAQNQYCDPTNNNVQYLWYAGAESNPITQANVNFTPSVSGKYWFLIETYSNKDVGITMNLSAQNGQTATVVYYSTMFSTGVYVVTQTLSTVSSMMTQQPSPSGGLGDMFLPIIAVVIVAIVAIVGYVVMKRGKTSGKAATAVPGTGEKFCMSCGAPIAGTSKFCKKCGAKQE